MFKRTQLERALNDSFVVELLDENMILDFLFGIFIAMCMPVVLDPPLFFLYVSSILLQNFINVPDKYYNKTHFY